MIGRKKILGKFKKQKNISFKILLVFLVLAIIHPYIANERPIICKIDGKLHFPITKQFFVNVKLSKPYKGINTVNWSKNDFEFRWMPVVPYSYNTIDRRNASYKSPFEKQEIDNLWQRHWLGTDVLGRDVLAGLFKGTEIAVKIGIISVFFAFLISLVLGLGAAYSQRFPLKINWLDLILMILGFIYIIYYLWLTSQTEISILLISSFILLLFWSAYHFLVRKWKVYKKFKKINFPFDSIILRMIEAMRAIPILIFLLAAISVFESVSVLGLITILALLMWPGITRYVRSEAMKVLNQDYITVSKSFGISGLRILRVHVLPKLFTSLSIILAFAISATVLVESTLSFLGIGLSVEQVSWGGMLKEARTNFSAWWMAIFPGICLFILLISLNSIGEDLEHDMRSS